MAKLVCGVGINDVNYKVVRKFTVIGATGQTIKTSWTCPFYRAWTNMINRCYNERALALQPSYRGCTVCEEWLLFSNFKKWMETQDWEGKQLDKDLLIRGNKIYSPDTCLFLASRINYFIKETNKSRGMFKIGVSWHKWAGKFTAAASCCGKDSSKKYLGYFDTEQEAHKAWLTAKLEQARILSAEQSDPRIAKALKERYENYKENV